MVALSNVCFPVSLLHIVVYLFSFGHFSGIAHFDIDSVAIPYSTRI